MENIKIKWTIRDTELIFQIEDMNEKLRNIHYTFNQKPFYSISGWKIVSHSYPEISVTDKTIYLRGILSVMDERRVTFYFDSVKDRDDFKREITAALEDWDECISEGGWDTK